MVDLISVSRGTITAKGNFISDIKDNNSGRVDIIWNTIADVTDSDGSLFYVVAKKKGEQLKIKISYSQEDTFNEKYKDVRLDCREMNIENGIPLKSTENINQDKNEEGSPVIDSEEKAEENAVNEYVTAKGERADRQSEPEEQVKKMIIEQLKASGYRSVDEVPDSEREEFTNEVKESLKQAGVNVDNNIISDAMNDIDFTQEIPDSTHNTEKKNNRYRAVIVSVIMSVIILSFVTGAAIYMRKIKKRR